MARVVILGGAGVFGRRIAALFADPAVRVGPPLLSHLYLAGRTPAAVGAEAAALTRSPASRAAAQAAASAVQAAMASANTATTTTAAAAAAAATPPTSSSSASSSSASASSSSSLTADAVAPRAAGDEVVVVPVAVDTKDRGALAALLAAVRPHVVINAVGPFQGADYSVPVAAVAAGAHYIDLADGREYVAGVPPALDAAAKAAGVTVLLGASTTPTITAAAAQAVSGGWQAVDTVDSAIAPGNQTARGLATTKAILSYVGRPIPWYDGGRTASVAGWSHTQRVCIRVGTAALGCRWVSAVDTPDVALLPSALRVRNRVTLRAGLELSALHLGLAAYAAGMRVAALPPLAAYAPTLLRIANALGRWGSADGGMVVDVTGIDADGTPARARFSMIACDGVGPYTPALPAVALTRALLDSAATSPRLPPGAMPAIGQLPLAAIFHEAGALGMLTAISRVPPVYETATGAHAFTVLPAAIRALHTVHTASTWVGAVDITPATGVLARAIATVFGMPRVRASRAPLRFDLSVGTHAATGAAVETWTRRFAAGTPDETRFVSTQEGDGATPGTIVERFGPWAFHMMVGASPTGIDLHLCAVHFWGIPVPPVLWPSMTARERIVDGRFSFDVSIALPLAGHLVAYTGTLEPAARSS